MLTRDAALPNPLSPTASVDLTVSFFLLSLVALLLLLLSLGYRIASMGKKVCFSGPWLSLCCSELGGAAFVLV